MCACLYAHMICETKLVFLFFRARKYSTKTFGYKLVVFDGGPTRILISRFKLVMFDGGPTSILIFRFKLVVFDGGPTRILISRFFLYR